MGRDPEAVSVASVTIRPMIAADEGAVAELVQSAFSASEHGHNGEAGLVAALRADGDAVLERVAGTKGKVSGHIMFSRMDVVADGTSLRAAALAPVSVRPDLWGRGIASALIRDSLDLLRSGGWQIVFVLGSDQYYPRFGFAAEQAKCFASPYAGPYFMAVMLDTNLAVPQRGQAGYASAFGRI